MVQARVTIAEMFVSSLVTWNFPDKTDFLATVLLEGEHVFAGGIYKVWEYYL
jgi:hypothetical protein